MLIGYARSSLSQPLEGQQESLRGAGCERLFSEGGGLRSEERPELQSALGSMREGDVLVVTRLARFAKDLTELNRLLDELAAKRVGLRCLEQEVVDSTQGGWEAAREAIRSCAVFEDDLKRERRREGIQATREAHPELYRGRPPKIDKARVVALDQRGMKPPEIASEMGIGLASVYRALGPKKAKQAPA